MKRKNVLASICAAIALLSAARVYAQESLQNAAKILVATVEVAPGHPGAEIQIPVIVTLQNLSGETIRLGWPYGFSIKFCKQRNGTGCGATMSDIDPYNYKKPTTISGGSFAVMELAPGQSSAPGHTAVPFNEAFAEDGVYYLTPKLHVLTPGVTVKSDTVVIEKRPGNPIWSLLEVVPGK